MLYVSTRDKNDAFTAHMTLQRDYAFDGGAFVPFHLPTFFAEELAGFRGMTFGECAAYVLRRFFPIQINGADVDFRIGRTPVRIVRMNRRILIAETWHNLERDYACAVRTLYRLIAGAGEETQPTDWSIVAIRIAVLFGIYGELLRQELLDGTLDVAVNAEDFSTAMAVWYARAMGLPIGTVICSCNTGSAVWELLHHGGFNATNAGTNGETASIERLLHGTVGTATVQRYLQGNCQLSEGALDTVRQGFYAAVVGDSRVPAIIGSVYQTGAYLIDPAAALSYGGLQDYRASAGESRLTLLLSDSDPLATVEIMAKATGRTPEELIKRKITT